MKKDALWGKSNDLVSVEILVVIVSDGLEKMNQEDQRKKRSLKSPNETSKMGQRKKKVEKGPKEVSQMGLRGKKSKKAQKKRAKWV